MSYAVRRPGREAPTTAAVLDFGCLFTHDLRRKQKRWQDGRLKYHTFNRRVMVYDERGNLVGDGHWTAGLELDEGAELELDRGAAIVQVAQCTGVREQDLSEVVDRRAREVAQRRARARERPRPGPVVQSPGPLGRAVVPERSPYEARREKAGHAQSLFGARLTLASGPVRPRPTLLSGPVRARADVVPDRPGAPREQRPSLHGDSQTPDLSKAQQREERVRPTAIRERAAPAIVISDDAAEETNKCALPRGHEEDATVHEATAERDRGTPPQTPTEERPQPRRAGPRAELRIRPRQRRGLLMLSEQRQRQAARELDACPKPCADRRSEEPETHRTVEAIPEPGPSGDAAPVMESSDSDMPPVASVDRRRRRREEPSSDDDAAPAADRRRRRAESGSDDEAPAADWRPPPDRSSASESDADGSDSPASSAASERRRPARDSDESDSAPSPPPKRRAKRNQAKPAATGPRITKMARKSVKSREIIGFVPPAADLVPAAFATATGPIASAGPAAAPAGANPALMANPATRGRKAARREDAAGAAPQSLVPLEPVAAPEPKLTCLPGFSWANGGAWSKHAEDLLGRTRPRAR